MKKAFLIILALVILCGSLAGCIELPVEVTQNVHNGNQNGGQNTGNGTGNTTAPNAVATSPQEVTVEKTVVYDQNNVKITVTGLENGWLGKELKLLVENNTTHNIALSADEFIINGITVIGFAYIEVAAGKKANGSFEFYSTTMEVAGIDTFATIDAPDAHIVDTDSYDTLMQTPFSVVTSAGADYQQPIRDDGDVIFQEAGVTVIAQKYTHDIWGPAIRLVVKNETGKNIIVSAENVSVNDFTISAWLYDTVYRDTVRFCELDLFDSGLEENGIEKVQYVTFTLEIIENATWDRIAVSGELKVIVG